MTDGPAGGRPARGDAARETGPDEPTRPMPGPTRAPDPTPRTRPLPDRAPSRAELRHARACAALALSAPGALVTGALASLRAVRGAELGTLLPMALGTLLATALLLLVAALSHGEAPRASSPTPRPAPPRPARAARARQSRWRARAGRAARPPVA